MFQRPSVFIAVGTMQTCLLLKPIKEQQVERDEPEHRWRYLQVAPEGRGHNARHQEQHGELEMSRW